MHGTIKTLLEGRFQSATQGSVYMILTSITREKTQITV